MLHKLSLVVNNSDALAKLAVITEAENNRLKALYENKARALAEQRGVAIPEGANMSGVRMSPKGMSTADMARNPAAVHPNASAAYHQAPNLVDAEVQKAHSAFTPGSKLRHNTVGAARRFWHGQNGLHSAWGNRLALGASLGAVGLGIKNYMDSNRIYDDMPKMSALGFNNMALNTQKSLRPKITAPGPGTPSVAMGTSALPGSTPGMPAPSAPSTSAGSRGTATKSANDATLPVLAGGLGGIGGWALGEKVLKPAIENREASLAAAIAKQQRNVERMAALKPYLPIGASIVGAILLAGAAAAMANRRNGSNAGVYAGVGYDPYGGSGYLPNEREIPSQYYGG